jgi:hypothetical protein
MLKSLKTAVLALPALLMTGCVVYSLNPFCVKDRLIKTDVFNGEWRLLESAGESVAGRNISPWRFSPDKIIAFDKENMISEFKVSYFKIQDTLLMDIVSERFGGGAYRNMSVIPAHILLKAERAGDTLTLTPLNCDWLQKKDNAKAQNLKYAAYDGDDKVRIYFNSPAEWGAFLESAMAEPELFNVRQKFTLRAVSPETTK